MVSRKGSARILHEILLGSPYSNAAAPQPSAAYSSGENPSSFYASHSLINIFDSPKKKIFQPSQSPDVPTKKITFHIAAICKMLGATHVTYFQVTSDTIFDIFHIWSLFDIMMLTGSGTLPQFVCFFGTFG
jgi:hypothetical protein